MQKKEKKKTTKYINKNTLVFNKDLKEERQLKVDISKGRLLHDSTVSTKMSFEIDWIENEQPTIVWY